MENVLPKVNPDIGHSIVADLEPNDKKNIKTHLKRIKKENPYVADFIKRWAELAEDEDASIHSAFCGILVYRMLESQGEVDKMEEEINLG